jgi:hypothetical protein
MVSPLSTLREVLPWGNAVTAYLFTGKRFMCGEYLRRHRIAPGTLTADEASYDQQMELAAVR